MAIRRTFSVVMELCISKSCMTILHLVGYQHAAINNAVNVSAALLDIKNSPPVSCTQYNIQQIGSTWYLQQIYMRVKSALLHYITDTTENACVIPGATFTKIV